MKKTTIMIVITLSTLFLIGGVAACKHGHRPGGFDEFDLAAVTSRIASRLDLTESQKADLEQIAGEIAEKAKGMHADRASRAPGDSGSDSPGYRWQGCGRRVDRRQVGTCERDGRLC